MSIVDRTYECKKCKKNTLYNSYNVRTEEENSVCSTCGFIENFNIVRKNGKAQFAKRELSKNDIYIIIHSLNQDEDVDGLPKILEEKKITTETADEIQNSFKYLDNNRRQALLLKENGKSEMIFGFFEELENGKILNTHLKWIHEIKDGFGTVHFKTESGKTFYIRESKEYNEKIKELIVLAKEKNMLVTKFNPETGELIVESGTIQDDLGGQDDL